MNATGRHPTQAELETLRFMVEAESNDINMFVLGPQTIIEDGTAFVHRAFALMLSRNDWVQLDEASETATLTEAGRALLVEN